MQSAEALSGLRPWQGPHVQKILAGLQRYRAALDASDTGTGKTYCTLAVAKALGTVPLVVGPRGSRATWELAARQLGTGVEYVGYEKCRGRRTTGDDGLSKPAESEWVREVPWGSGSFLKWKNDYELIVFDEAHRCSGNTSLQSKLMIAAKRQAKYCLALSATAADNPLQMKALGYLLGLHDLNGKRFGFRNWILRNGCKPAWSGGFEFTDDEAERRKAFESLNKQIFGAGRGARMRKSEIPGFPETVLGIKLLSDETGNAAKLAEELHALYELREKQEDTLNESVAAIRCRQKLELLMIPDLLTLAEDYKETGSVVFFVNFTDTLDHLVSELERKFPGYMVGRVDGSQAGEKGMAERNKIIGLFQSNLMKFLVCNTQAGGESINLHDPTGQVERTTFILPVGSGRRLTQIFGRVNRDGGAFSQQFLLYFEGTRQEETANAVLAKLDNIELLNDADLTP